MVSSTTYLPLLFFMAGLVSAAPSPSGQNVLANDALVEILSQGAPILGFDQGCPPSSKTCDWMAKYPDSTKLVHMNLPGTHDTATWNYSASTQASLIRYTGSSIPPAEVFRCQEHSIFQSLNAGVRVFDLRFAYNPGNDTIGFYHSQALLSPTTTLQHVLYGFYSWLAKHNTEAVLISLKYEGGTGTPYDTALQVKLYEVLNSTPALRYWSQTEGQLGTLGQARGQITLLQRFDWDLLPSQYAKRTGLLLGPSKWTDNGLNIEIIYSSRTNPPQAAYIEDYYEPSTVGGAAPAIQAKFEATSAHIANATSGNNHPDQLYITFASAERNDQGVNPKIMALGDGSAVPGVNQRLLPFLRETHKKAPGGRARIGVVMLDFYDAVEGLVEAVIGL